MITIRQVNNDPRGMKDFINLQYTLYRDDANWCPPLRVERKKFFSARNPFMLHGRVAYFVAYRQNRPVGRVTAHTDRIHDAFYRTRQGFFGFFESENNPVIAEKLMESVENWLAGHGVESILGPFNFSTNHEVGFLAKGFDRPPVMMMPYTKPYYPGLVLPLGYQREKTLFAYWMENVKQVPSIIAKAASRLEREYANDVAIRHIDKKNLRTDLQVILDIYNEAWCNNWGFVPMTPEEIDQMTDELKFIANPAITFILSFREEPAAILIALPDFNELLMTVKDGRLLPTGFFKLLFRRNRIRTVRLILMGVRNKYQKLGLDILLYNQLFRDGFQEGSKKTTYRNIEMSWVLEDNVMLTGILRRVNIDPYKEYLVLKKEMPALSGTATSLL